MNTSLPFIHEHHFRAMGSEIAIWLQHSDADEANAALFAAEDLFDAAERRMSRFDPASELSELNRNAGRWMPVSRLLWRVIGRALQLAEETGGLFDPTIGNAMLASGYRSSFDAAHRWDSANGTNADLPLLGQWRQVELDPGRHAIRWPAEMRLDLGGIGKGFTAQQVVDYLAPWGPCLVDAGGDVTAGDGPTGEPGWAVGIAQPSADNNDAATPAVTVWLNNATLATSGVDYRWWMHDGRRRHHLIDPRTGDSAQTDLVTASVLAADASAAEAWATAALIAGQAASLARARQGGWPLLLINTQGAVHVTPGLERFLVQPTYLTLAAVPAAAI